MNNDRLFYVTTIAVFFVIIEALNYNIPKWAWAMIGLTTITLYLTDHI